MKKLLYLAVGAGVLVIGGAAWAGEWANWRGPDGLGVSTEKGIAVEWSKEKNILWKATIPGMGTSSPTATGSRVYVSTQTEDDGLHLMAINAGTGGKIWDREIGKGRVPTHNLHNMATPTPVSDGKHVWVHFGTGDLACLDFNGNTVWHRNLAEEYGKYNTNHGMGNSPMLLDGRLIIVCMHQGPSYIMAIDPLTGENLWKTDRNLESKEEALDSYSSPIVARHNGRPLLIVSGADHLTAYDPEDGSQVWISSGLQVPHPYGRAISGPTYGEDVVITVASGFRNQGFVIAVDPSGKGDITESGRLWESRRYAPDCPCPLIVDGMVFMIRDDGMASCLDLKTGEAHWQERLFSQNVKVSPIAVDGKIYFSSGEGECKVVEAGKEFKVLHHNDLDEYLIATPAVAHGRLFIRTATTLYCIANQRQQD